MRTEIDIKVSEIDLNDFLEGNLSVLVWKGLLVCN